MRKKENDTSIFLLGQCFQTFLRKDCKNMGFVRYKIKNFTYFAILRSLQGATFNEDLTNNFHTGLHIGWYPLVKQIVWFAY